MKLKLNKLKNDSQEIINNLQATVDSLIKIAFEYQTENENLMAEIAQWKNEANKYQNLWCEAVKDIQTAKSEAYKEFWGKLRKSIKQSVEDAWHGDGNGIYDAECVLDDGDNLVKEMVGAE